MPKNGAAHPSSLWDGREVFLDGARVGDVTVGVLRNTGHAFE